MAKLMSSTPHDPESNLPGWPFGMMPYKVADEQQAGAGQMVPGNAAQPVYAPMGAQQYQGRMAPQQGAPSGYMQQQPGAAATMQGQGYAQPVYMTPAQMQQGGMG